MEIKYVIVKNKDGTAVKRLSKVKSDEIILSKLYSEIEEIVTENDSEIEEEVIEDEDIEEESDEILTEEDLFSMDMKELRAIGKKYDVKDNKKVELIEKILEKQ